MKKLWTNNWKNDLQIAFLSAFFAIPQAFAFARLAGLPIIAAVMACIIPAAIAIVLSGEYFILTGPSAVISIALYTGLSEIAKANTIHYYEMTMIITLMMGVLQYLIVKTKILKTLMSISYWINRGTIAGLGFLIIFSQFPIIFGNIDHHSYDFLSKAYYAISHKWDLLNIAIFLSTFIVFAIIEKIKIIKNLKFAIGVIIVSGVLSLLKIHHFILGETSFTNIIPHWNFQNITNFDWFIMIKISFILAIIGIMQSLLVDSFLKQEGIQNINYEKESVAQGVANIFSAFTTGFPVSASINRSLAHYYAGAKNIHSSIYSFIMIIFLVLLLAPFTSLLSLPSLSAMICAVAFPMIKPMIDDKAKDKTHITIAFCIITLCAGIGYSILLGILNVGFQKIYQHFNKNFRASKVVIEDKDFLDGKKEEDNN
jgi:SulP family sulfate permease